LSLPQQQLLTGTRQFVVGDGATYGNYRNVRLSPNSLYIFYFVVALTLDGVTKMAFSTLATPVRTTTTQSSTFVSSTAPASGNGSSPGLQVTSGGGVSRGGGGRSSSRAVVAVVVVVLLVIAIAATVFVVLLIRRRRRRKQQLDAALEAVNKSRRMAANRNGNGFTNAEVKGSQNPEWIQYYSNRFYNASSAIPSSVAELEVETKTEARHETRDESRFLQVADIGKYQSLVNIDEQFRQLPGNGEVNNNNNNGGLSSRLDTDNHIQVSLLPSRTGGSGDRNPLQVRCNASFMSGYGSGQSRAYIVAQSPFDMASADRFWELVRQERVTTIVAAKMAEAEAETTDASSSVGAPASNSVYSPSEGQGYRFGRNYVQTVQIRRLASIDVITYRVQASDAVDSGVAATVTAKSSSSASTALRVHEYRFLEWPPSASGRTQRGATAVPASPLAFLEFRNKVRRAVAERNERRRCRRRLRADSGKSVAAADDDEGGPLLVHCPTGLGASAVFVAVDQLLDEAAAENRVSVYDVIAELRRRRPMAISSRGEYAFVFEALAEALGAGYASSKSIGSDLKLTYRIMSKPIASSSAAAAAAGSAGRTGFDEQFDALVEQTKPSRSADRNAPAAAAGFVVDSYRYREGFVMVDIPNAARAESFWRLVVGCRARSIVTLTSDRDAAACLDSWTPAGWQKGVARCFGSMRVDVVSIDGGRNSMVRSRTMKVADERDKTASAPLVIRQFVFDGWPRTEPVPPREEFIRLIG
jgi:protein tyrosine phosphatase